jgi:hypothetical protein
MDAELRGAKGAGDAEEIRWIIAGAFAVIDPVQVAITRRLTPAERFQEGCSIQYRDSSRVRSTRAFIRSGVG